MDTNDPDALLPLPPAAFHLLLVLAAGERHGYGILQDVAARTGGAVRLGPGTLYRTLQRLLEEGSIVEVREGPGTVVVDPRRRTYRITPFGAAVARAEARRLEGLVDLARAAGVVPEMA